MLDVKKVANSLPALCAKDGALEADNNNINPPEIFFTISFSVLKVLAAPFHIFIAICLFKLIDYINAHKTAKNTKKNVWVILTHYFVLRSSNSPPL